MAAQAIGDESLGSSVYVIEIRRDQRHDALVNALTDRLQQRRLHVERYSDPKKTFLYIQAPTNALLWEAEEYKRRHELKDYFLNVKGKEYALKNKMSLSHELTATWDLTPEFEERLLRHVIDSIEVRDGDECLGLRPEEVNESLVKDLVFHNVIPAVYPLHCKAARKPLWRAALASVFAPVQLVYNYFGSKPAYYFAWLNHYCLWLALPAAIGVFVNYIESGGDVDNAWVVAYSLFMIFWSSLFIRYWERKSAQLSLDWGITVDEAPEETVRKEFEGEKRTSPITGKPELYFDHHRRYLRMAVSIPVISIMLCFALLIMVFGLNINGYMSPTSPIYFELLNCRNPEVPGMLYPDDPWYIKMLPAILHSVPILCLNMIYAKVAERLTEWENYRTVEAFEAALILKRVPFEMFDCYVSLFYLAFYEGDMAKLRAELTSLFLADTCRRVLMEFVVPLLLMLRRQRKDKKKNDEVKKDQHLRQTLRESKLAPREDFDDYIELVVQFGYIVLFAAALPMASLFALVANMVEMRTDLLKNLYVNQRPGSVRVMGIGPWLPVMKIISDLAVLTNSAIFGYTSNQVEVLIIGPNAHTFVGDHVATSMAIIFLVEHVVFVLKKALEANIHSLPSSVYYTIKRREYVRAEALRLYKAEQVASVVGKKSN